MSSRGGLLLLASSNENERDEQIRKEGDRRIGDGLMDDIGLGLG